MNEPLIVLFKEKIFYRKSIGGGAFFANSSISYFSGNFFFEGHSSDQTGSNDTEFVSCLGAEKMGGSHTQILSIIYRDFSNLTFILNIK